MDTSRIKNLVRPYVPLAASLAEPPPPRWRFLQTGDLRRLRNFQFAARLVVEGYFQGRHRSPYFDFSSEFADYRPYVPGDEIRAIDWRAYARTDRYYIKLYRKETDMNCYLLVDKSRSMAFQGGNGVGKFEYAGYMAAALSYLMLRQGDKAGLALGDESLRTFIPPGGTQQNLQRILTTLEQTEPSGTTGIGSTLQTLFGVIKRRGLLVVISDFLDDPDRLFSALSMFTHRGFTVLLLQVLTDDEIHLPSVDNALFQDMESAATVSAEPELIRRAYEKEIQAFLGGIEGQAKARRIHYHLATTSTPYYEALESYLTTRSGMRS
jgi:uncharacterized protein (DUF58 family)